MSFELWILNNPIDEGLFTTVKILDKWVIQLIIFKMKVKRNLSTQFQAKIEDKIINTKIKSNQMSLSIKWTNLQTKLFLASNTIAIFLVKLWITSKAIYRSDRTRTSYHSINQLICVKSETAQKITVSRFHQLMQSKSRHKT